MMMEVSSSHKNVEEEQEAASMNMTRPTTFRRTTRSNRSGVLPLLLHQYFAGVVVFCLLLVLDVPRTSTMAVVAATTASRMTTTASYTTSSSSSSSSYDDDDDDDDDDNDDDDQPSPEEWWRESCQPRQIHLALGGGGQSSSSSTSTSTSMRISFAVTRFCRPTPSTSTQIRVVTSSSVEDDKNDEFKNNKEEEDGANGEIVTIATVDDWKGYTYISPDNVQDHDDDDDDDDNDDMYVSDDFYHVLVGGLQPDTKYAYHIEVELTHDDHHDHPHDDDGDDDNDDDDDDSNEADEVFGVVGVGAEDEEAAELVLGNIDGVAVAVDTSRRRRQQLVLHPHHHHHREDELLSSMLDPPPPPNSNYYTATVDHYDEDNTTKQIVRSTTGQFTTPPLPGHYPTAENGIDKNDNDIQHPLQFAFVGDVGISDAGQSTLHHMTNLHTNTNTTFHSIMLVGDVSYANGDQSVWDDWFDIIQPLTSRCPLQVTPGNHEIEVDGRNGDIFVPYDSRFVMPEVAPVYKLPSEDASIHGGSDLVYEYGNAFYSYTYGPCRFIVLSSFSVTTQESTQFRWLHEELKSVDRKVTPWVIVNFHVPWYNTFESHHQSKPATEMKVAMETMFGIYRVSMVFSGHVHAYSRSHPVLYDKVSKSGPVHVVIGDGGRGHGSKFDNPDEPEEWVAKRDEKMHGFGILKVMNDTHAHWKWIRNVDEHFSTVHDETYIENSLFV